MKKIILGIILVCVLWKPFWGLIGLAFGLVGGAIGLIFGLAWTAAVIALIAGIARYLVRRMRRA
jgi:uncharacterized membrane protein YjjP (DUF1212 family)